ncbi:response regulator transcription factor [Cysteiniphilum sp. 6C5]|uniref:response regulator transcription factor n=1 Tax=unclassified Cysteiniphilum TaxID=2610889 RepID=UPI003F863ADD
MEHKQKDFESMHVFKVMPEVIEIAQPLYEDSGIHFLTYCKHYTHGEFSDLGTPREWAMHYLNNHLKPENSVHRFTGGINYWRRNKNEHISEIAEDARENFDIDARIEFVVEDKSQNCFHMYSFHSNKKNADKAYRFYDLHRAKLLKFISYFNKKAAHLIREADLPENRIQIPNYLPPTIQQPKRDYASELLQENASNELKDREFEIMLLYANGCTDSQIAKMLNRSQNTVSTYLRNIREKTGCHDKRSLHKYVVEHGYDGLEQFFFPYIRH